MNSVEWTILGMSVGIPLLLVLFIFLAQRRKFAKESNKEKGVENESI